MTTLTPTPPAARTGGEPITDLRDFHRLAVVGSRWLRESRHGQPAVCTIIQAHDGRPTRFRGLRPDGSTLGPGRLDLPAARLLTFTGDAVQVRLDDGTGGTDVLVQSWRYLGPPTGPVAQPPTDPAMALACRVSQLQPGDVIYGPARQHTAQTPGYTVDTVDLTTEPALITTREGWPLRHASWQLLAVVPAGDPHRCEPVPPLPSRGRARVYLGVHTLAWLGRPDLADVPKCVSRNRIAGYRGRRLPRPTAPVLIDSGAFTELKQHGRWRLTAAEYVTEIRQIIDQLGTVVVAVAQQDWMCEPVVIEGGRTKDGTFVGTRRLLDPDGRLTLDQLVEEHQRRGVANLIELRRLAPDLPIFPVLTGRTVKEYIRHGGMFTAAGVAFIEEPLVGVGSVCRRQGTREIAGIVSALSGFRLHGFGVGQAGLLLYGNKITSVDSMAFSYHGRRVGRCPHGVVRWEANCPVLARRWWDTAQGYLDRAAARPPPAGAA